MRMIEFLYSLGVVYLGVFLKDFILPAFLLSVMGIGLSLVLRGIRNKKYIKSIVGVFLTGIIVLLFLRSGFIRSRRVVDTEWMIGKTVEQVRDRYYYPQKVFFTSEKINGKTYTLCNVETQIWKNPWDEYYDGRMYYYVLTDSDGRITDVVYRNANNLDGELPEHNYISRWYYISL